MNKAYVCAIFAIVVLACGDDSSISMQLPPGADGAAGDGGAVPSPDVAVDAGVDLVADAAHDAAPSPGDAGVDAGESRACMVAPIRIEACGGDAGGVQLCWWRPDEPNAPELRVSGCFAGGVQCSRCCPGEVSGYCPPGGAP